MKVIFLDIDGVLNSNDWYVRRQTEVAMDAVHAQYPFYEIDPNAVIQLNRITDATGAKIVISSTWRLGRTLEQLHEFCAKVGITGEIIDKTLHFGGNKLGYSFPRGCEIEWWLETKDFQRINWSREKQLEYIEKSEVKNYIILDDDSDMLLCQAEHFVKTPHMFGLNARLADKSIKILNKTLIDLYYKPKKSK
jgi:hypothetical protein